jgi:3'-phosphoadenosine 5'-phosphosulfate sulfotransferase (PAPS reductase)/FAD synthetase
MKVIVVSFSGGKDSTACAVLAKSVAQGHADTDVRLVFADTGNEHPVTLEYVHNYIPSALGIDVEVVRPDFSDRIAAKRVYVAEKWPGKGVPQEAIDRVLACLRPTGVPFLDLCLWKGRFPSRMAQFCTQELKRYPLDAYMLGHLAQGHAVESWQGIRRDESRNRSKALAEERTPEGWTIIRPILDWTAERVVSYVTSMGVQLNPLYTQGMGRVGCMPCINVAKNELQEIAGRFPEQIDKIREWERLVSEASKRGWTTFFTDSLEAEETDAQIFDRLRIDKRVMWSKTSHGGKQISLLKLEPSEGCSSSYGLCE